jgi:hypothetical protein
MELIGVGGGGREKLIRRTTHPECEWCRESGLLLETAKETEVRRRKRKKTRKSCVWRSLFSTLTEILFREPGPAFGGWRGGRLEKMELFVGLQAENG